MLFLAIAAVLGLLLAGPAAADSPLIIKGQLDKTVFTGPAKVTVAITISNAGEGDMPGPVTLYYPSGKQVEEFGSPTLTVGASRSWAGTWDVSQKELEAGKISLKSPIGAALMGKKVGETVEVRVPSGTLRLRIDSITQ